MCNEETRPDCCLKWISSRSETSLAFCFVTKCLGIGLRDFLSNNALRHAGLSLRFCSFSFILEMKEAYLLQYTDSMVKEDFCICIVDDEREMRSLLRDYFSDQGYVIREYASGQEVLDFLDTFAVKAKNPDRPVDLIISDINMPGMSGIDLLDHIKTRFPKIPMILMTAYGVTPAVQSVLSKGAEAFIEKPFGLKEMSLVAETAIKKASSA